MFFSIQHLDIICVNINFQAVFVKAMILETTFCLLWYVSVCSYAVCSVAINVFHSFIRTQTARYTVGQKTVEPVDPRRIPGLGAERRGRCKEERVGYAMQLTNWAMYLNS